MSSAGKAEVLAKVASSGRPKRETLGGLGIPKSTHYRWLRRKEREGLRTIQEAAIPHGTS